MATTTASITFTNTFADGTSGNLTINNVQSTAINKDDVKAAIKDFNSKIEESEFPRRLVSKTGAYWKRISGCKITTTTRNYLF